MYSLPVIYIKSAIKLGELTLNTKFNVEHHEKHRLSKSGSEKRKRKAAPT